MTPAAASLSQLSVNERRIMDLVCRKGPIARTDIAASMGLTNASITRLTKDLEDRGLLIDTVQRNGARGQPSRPLSLNPQAAFSAGVYFSHSYAEIGLTDLAGRLISVERKPLRDTTPEMICAVAHAAVQTQLQASGIQQQNLIGLGFALPADFSATPPHLSVHSYFPGLMQRDVHGDLRAASDAHVFIENDAASAAIGERIHGVGRQYDNYLFVHLGHGVGGGIVIDGNLYRGVNGNAGIIGMQFPNDRPRPSGQDLLEHLRKAGLKVADFTDLDGLWPDTCAPLAAWLDRAADQLAEGIEVVARILDPQAVILGGRLPPHLIDALHQRVMRNAFALSRHLPQPAIVTSRLGSRAGVIGAASLPMFATFFSGSRGPQGGVAAH
ncbi:MAG TPA: hypothetical protein DCL48_14640 [Alphaproteobacteria bacterium]|nr:hypothetical protein [Alphaproteobacteria bacterium]